MQISLENIFILYEISVLYLFPFQWFPTFKYGGKSLKIYGS